MGSIIFIPTYFGFEINRVLEATKPNETEAYFQLGISDFGQTVYFKIFGITLAILESVVPLVSLSVLSLASLFKFRKVMNEKKRLTIIADTNELMTERMVHIDQASIRITKLIIALTLIQILTRLFDASTTILARLSITYDEAKTLCDSLPMSLKKLSQFLLISVHSLDGVFYFVYDNQLRRALERLLIVRRQYDLDVKIFRLHLTWYETSPLIVCISLMTCLFFVVAFFSILKIGTYYFETFTFI